MLFDSHCHIQFKGFEKDYPEVIKRCQDKEVILNAVGTQKNTSKKAIEFADKFAGIYTTIGLHPIHLFSTHVDEEESSFVSREENFDYAYYRELAQHPKVIAVGECGLDFFHIPKNTSKEKVFETQKEAFFQHSKLAEEFDLPLVIHVRDAYEEMIELLPDQVRGVVHCYASNWTNAQKFLDKGLHLGFTGIITFPAKKTNPKIQEDLLEVVENCPLERMLVETDAPYLAPQAYRGKRCEPWMVEEVVKKIAEIKGLLVEEVAKKVLGNSKKLFDKLSLF